ncbi:MAG: alpha-hydroxy acid oxidase [Pseudomonadota bacterium]
MKLRDARSIDDLRDLARRRLPRMVFDYLDGGAEDEIALRANRSAFETATLTGRVLRDISSVSTETTILGETISAPVIIAPTAASRLFHPRAGERAVAAAANDAGLPYAVSTLATTRFSDIATIQSGPKWLQLYVWRDEALVDQMLDDALAAGFTALILTVDTPVAGKRERDPRNGFSIPPKVNLKTATQALARPRYLLDVATSSKIVPANVPKPAEGLDIMAFINSQFDPGVDWSYLERLVARWPGPVLVKGIAHPDDGLRALDIGAAGIWVSNHGGRQLGQSPATLDLLPPIRAAVGSEATVILDGGIRRGSHIAIALDRGANAVAIGRPYLYGLAAAGSNGVAKALDILRLEYELALSLTGQSQSLTQP